MVMLGSHPGFGCALMHKFCTKCVIFNTLPASAAARMEFSVAVCLCYTYAEGHLMQCTGAFPFGQQRVHFRLLSYAVCVYRASAVFPHATSKRQLPASSLISD